jgi:predicted nicotinamide N-methyase
LQADAIAPADSGYVSETEDKVDQQSDVEDFYSTLRGDAFERDMSVRWLTSLIARAEELSIESDETRTKIVDEAAFILSSFSDSSSEDPEEGLARDFSFPTSLPFPAPEKVEVRLNDAPLSNTDHTDVGLQSWGASIILSGLMCLSPSRFGLDRLEPGSTIVELGAGTGLVSLSLATLLPNMLVKEPTIVATDYHPAVFENLRANIITNFPEGTERVLPALLDWSAPSLDPPLHKPAGMLVAADVIYAPEHAIWLRDCASLLLAPESIFWLIVSVRTVGKFEGIPETVDAAFAAEDCPERDGCVLQILGKERLERVKGIGRGDEEWYNLYKIGWIAPLHKEAS